MTISSLSGWLIVGSLGLLAYLMVSRAWTSRVTRTAEAKAARKANEPEPKPPRWTAKEVVDVLGAIVPVVAAVTTLFTNVSNSRIGELTRGRDAAVAARDSARAELKAVRDSVAGMLHYELRTWSRLPVDTSGSATGQPVRLDDRARAGPNACTRRGPLTFDATGPATVRCGSGTYALKLTKPTSIYLVPSSP